LSREEIIATIEMVDVLSRRSTTRKPCQLSGGEYSLVKAAKKIVAWARNFIIKKGEHGAPLFHKSKILLRRCPWKKYSTNYRCWRHGGSGVIGHLRPPTTSVSRGSAPDGSAIPRSQAEKPGTEWLLNLSAEEKPAKRSLPVW
jgi:hypothetical protein